MSLPPGFEVESERVQSWKITAENRTVVTGRLNGSSPLLEVTMPGHELRLSEEQILGLEVLIGLYKRAR